ncbi:MAG: sigma 54-interacting transcriptional regulator [Deltaproteobacteria bacterium]|nr:sigma 54-interacting transcriptional regulator [Deltaproteobacteria bacterium]
MPQQPLRDVQTPVAKIDVLAASSLFEEDFSIDWLIQLTGLKASTILELLEKACDEGILIKRHYGQFLFAGSGKQKQYRKKLDGHQADQLHRKIVQVLLTELPDGEEKARRLVTHLLGVENDLERCHWLARAGELFLKSAKVVDAVRSYRKLLIDLSGFKGADADALYIRSALSFSKISDIQFDTQETQRFLNEALKRSKQAGDHKSVALFNMHIAKNQWYRSRYTSAIKRFNQAWETSISLQDPSLMRSAVTFSTFFHYWQGRFQEAVAIYERDVSDIDRSPEGDFPIMAAATVGYCYTLTGQPAQGIGIIDNLLSISKVRGETFLTAFCEVVMAITLLNIQRQEEALEFINRSYRKVSQWPDSPVHLFCLLLLSYAFFQKGKPQKSVSYLRTFLEKREHLEVSMWPYPYLMELCWEMEIGNLTPVKGLSIKREVESAFKTGNVFLAGIAYRYKALSLQRKGKNKQEVLRALQKSVSWLEKSGHKIEIARSRLALADHYFAQNQSKKGREVMQKTSSNLAQFNPTFIPGNLRPLIKTVHKNPMLPDNLVEIGQKISENGNSPELIHHLLKSTNQLLGAERGGVFVMKDEGNGPIIRLLAGQNLAPEQTDEPGFKFSMQAIRTVFESEKEILLNQVAQSVPLSQNTVRSLACTPIKQGSDLLGVLYHDNRLLPDAFRTEDLETLSFCSALAGLIMGHHNIFRELESIKSGSLETQDFGSYKTGAFDMIGGSSEMKKVYTIIEQVAGTDTTVLILGETGVGKELVASAIHQASSRRNEAFVAVNCNALADNLISSELFGHEKGAFTGAHEQRAGRFELAHKGTLFIDEIGEMPLETQVRLLRVLQTKTFERIGAMKTIRSDFRLIVATNRNIEAEVDKGNFRSDLFYRLSTFPVSVPPLRERRDDIPLLARHFFKKFSLSTGKKFTSFPEKEMVKLRRYHWPGNVRELEHCIERGAILSTGSIFTVPQLNPTFIRHQPINTQPGVSLAEIEKHHIIQTLTLTGWRIRGKGGAAEILELHPSTLYSRMKKLEINRPENVA